LVIALALGVGAYSGFSFSGAEHPAALSTSGPDVIVDEGATATTTPTGTPGCTGVLWDQIGSVGTNGTASQDFETANDAFDATAAEDFMVTSGQLWEIQKVVARGIYFNGSGPADSFNVRIGDSPGSGTEFTGLTYTQNGNEFEIPLPASVTLPAGIYWVSVQARMDFTPGGQWAWANRASLPFLSVARWRNPGGGYNIPQCVNFADRGATCGIDPAFPEQAFRLEGLIVGGNCSTPTATSTATSTPTATGTPARSTAFDYDGDHKSDISVFRPTDGAWYLQQSQAGLFGMLFGFGSDKIAPVDYDGDGKTDIAVYRPSTGIWYVVRSSDSTVSYYVFGLANDLPTPADYDGDGKADISVYRQSNGTWYRQNSATGGFFGIQFGASEDKPTIGDFDGDGKSDIAVFRPSTGAWYRINSSDTSIYGELFGFGTDVIAPADYDGDHKTDLAVYRPSASGICTTARIQATATMSSGWPATFRLPAISTVTARRMFVSSVRQMAPGIGRTAPTARTLPSNSDRMAISPLKVLIGTSELSHLNRR